jgi:tRNA A37 threonylcarbamoyladenosine dehydratase
LYGSTIIYSYLQAVGVIHSHEEECFLYRENNEERFSRTELLIGTEGIERLKKAKIAIFGIGGVGSFVVEALARAGVSNFVLIDNDKIDVTNINRQIIATTKTIGKYKTDVMKERILDINPRAEVKIFKEFFMPESKSDIINKELSYVADCIDTVTAKLEIIKRCKEKEIPVISAMGTGNKLEPTRFEITDIYKTTVCPLAKVMRKELKKRNIDNLKVIYSKEEQIKIEEKTPGSISFVPSSAGLILAGEIIKDIISQN